MSDFAIKVEGLGKKYLIKHQAAGGHATLRETLTDRARSLFGNRKPETGNRKSVEEFWALKDVSFEVKPGEVVGIIGRNGAGKSTLLKILSRITEPTAGRVRLRGRVASLLEVGTGFHPELTGRENIFLNGAVLGMHRVEIKKKFDEIVAFAEVEKFLDTPVKRYSSGMYVRLAFAVAAHLEPEILIVDEVLAVGDAAFQKKCLGKMQDVAKTGGRTILFVSHNMLAIRQLCSFAYLLDGGKIFSKGCPAQVAEEYLSNARAGLKKRNEYELQIPHIIDVELRGPNGTPVGNIKAGEDAALAIQIETRGRKRLNFGMTIFNSDDVGIFSTVTSDSFESIPADANTLSIEIPTRLLNAGRYRVEGALVDDSKLCDSNECYLQFEIHRGGSFDLAQGKPKGILRLPGTWTVLKK